MARCSLRRKQVNGEGTKVRECSVCHRPSNPVYMCDLDESGNAYCKECFVKVGCIENHPEDCFTCIMEAYD